MVEPTLITPITIKDIEEVEAQGLVREIVNGQWVNTEEAKMAGELHSAIATNLSIALGTYVRAHKMPLISSRHNQKRTTWTR